MEISNRVGNRISQDEGKIELVANINTTNCSTGMINHINTLCSEDAPIVLDTKKVQIFPAILMIQHWEYLLAIQ